MARTFLAYSYIRFSSAPQAEGDSVRRQEELREAWCAKNGVKLDETLRDEGVSAFRGKHRTSDKAALSRFLELVRRGTVAEGSYFIVESLDRLSREDIWDALDLFLQLIRAGIRIVQLQPVEQIFSKKDRNPMGVMMAIMELSRGHSESLRKSEMVGQAWERKRKEAASKPLTPSVPAWCKLVGGKIVLDEDKANVVRRIFQMAVDGHGIARIAKKLTADGVKPIAGRSKRWALSTVHHILHTRTVLGEYQPHTARGLDREKRVPDGPPVPGYYPPVITPERFETARQALSARRDRGSGRANKTVNVFSGLLFDARTGERLNVVNSVRAGRRVCPYTSTRTVSGSRWVSFSAYTFERAILSQLREVRAEDILPGNEGTVDTLAEAVANLGAIEHRIATFTKKLVASDEDVGPLVDALRQMENERKAAAEVVAQARQKASSPLSSAWGDCQSLVAALDAAEDETDVRTKLRAVLQRTVREIYCLFVPVGIYRYAAVQIWFEGGRHRDYLITHRQGGGEKPEQGKFWRVRSLAFPEKSGGLDLRKPDHVARAEKLLAGLDPAESELE